MDDSALFVCIKNAKNGFTSMYFEGKLKPNIFDVYKWLTLISEYKNTHTEREKEDNSMAFDCKSKQSSEMLKNESTPKSMAKMRMTAFATHTHTHKTRRREINVDSSSL